MDSKNTKSLWDYVCQKRLVYAIIISCWLLPIIIHIGRIFEKGITFQHGKANVYSIDHKNVSNHDEVGYLCYAYEGDKRLLFTPMSYIMNLVNDITVFLVILISSGISIIAFKKEVQKMNHSEEMKRDELKRFRFNFIARLKQRKLGAMIICVCLCYVMLRLPLTIIGNEGIPHLKFAFASCLFLYHLQFTLHSIIYPIGCREFRNSYLDVLKKVFPCFLKNESTVGFQSMFCINRQEREKTLVDKRTMI